MFTTETEKHMSMNGEQKEFLREKIRELHSKSVTQREIATVMHCSVATVKSGDPYYNFL